MASPAFGPPGDRVSVSVLTGFLGSGKTTLLNRLLRHAGMGQTAVIVNEWGEVAIDHLLVETATEDMVVLESGCVCCSMRNDLLETLAGLSERAERGAIPAFDRVVIETTGLADPAPILRTIMMEADLAEHYWLDAVLVTVDALNGEATLARQPEASKQVAVADRVLLTKLDLAGADAVARLDDRLWDINASAPHVEVHPGAPLDPERLFDVALFHRGCDRADVDGWLRDDAFEDEHASHGEVHSFCLTWNDPVPVAAFEAWLTSLLHFKGPHLLRVKGIVHLRELDRPAVIHVVQHAFHEPLVLDAWPTSDHRTRIVFITRGIERAAIEAALHTVLDAVE